jgi:hypothetical protein
VSRLLDLLRTDSLISGRKELLPLIGLLICNHIADSLCWKPRFFFLPITRPKLGGKPYR